MPNQCYDRFEKIVKCGISVKKAPVMLMDRVKSSLNKAVRTFINILPIVLGMLLLTSWVITVMPDEISTTVFSGHSVPDALLGASIGSIAAGHPLVSYLLGGELLATGVSLFAVTALIVSWVTVGIVQLPAEALLLGKRFAIYRNLISFVSAVAVAFLMVLTLRLMG